MEKFLFEESHIFSADITALLKHTVLIMANWKWIALAAFLIIGIFLRPVLQFVLKEFKKHNPWGKRFPKSFISYLFKLQIERPIAWVLIGLLWFACGDTIELTGKFQTYYEHFLKAFIAIHVIRLIYYAVDALGSVFADIAAKTESAMDH